MTSILSQLRASGFEAELMNDSNIWITPASKLSEEQYNFFKVHKAEIVDELKRVSAGIRVYKYRHYDYPNEYAVMITPGYTLDEARDRLYKRFGSDRILEIIDYQPTSGGVIK